MFCLFSFHVHISLLFFRQLNTILDLFNKDVFEEEGIYLEVLSRYEYKDHLCSEVKLYIPSVQDQINTLQLQQRPYMQYLTPGTYVVKAIEKLDKKWYFTVNDKTTTIKVSPTKSIAFDLNRDFPDFFSKLDSINLGILIVRNSFEIRFLPNETFYYHVSTDDDVCVRCESTPCVCVLCKDCHVYFLNFHTCSVKKNDSVHANDSD